MEMDLCLGTSKDPPLHTGRWQRQRLATILPKLGSVKDSLLLCDFQGACIFYGLGTPA